MKNPENLFQHWWWIVLCAIIFAAIGNLVTLLLPIRYEQTANLQILFKPNQNINWTDKDMLSFTETVGEMVVSSAVQSLVIDQLLSQDFDLSGNDLSRYIEKEQRYYGWKLIVNTNDAELTEAILSTWKSTVMELLENDLLMSQQAEEQRALVAAWIPCLQQLPAEPMHPFCNPRNAAEISSLYHQATDQYQTAVSNILFLEDYPPTYSITFLDTETAERIPMIDSSAGIFVGLLIGIALGTLTIQDPWTKHLNFKRGES